ncbi:MAG: N-acetylglucosamine-6-phosphate deacetylase [Verrucomicrobia bacterium]|nr:MAG: N-acetylglucosamine-6-phosphate deacetylase [Verrucomicrobiota bacterium]
MSPQPFALINLINLINPINPSDCGPILLEGRLFPDGRPVRIAVEDGRIASVSPASRLDEPAGAERWIVPGFFDLQVNGFDGRSFAGPEVAIEDVEHIARAVLRTGTTRFLPTVISADLDTLCRQLSVLAEAIERNPLVRAMCPGIHLEGPFISPEDGPRGAHRRQFLRDPSIADYEKLHDAARGRMVMLTLSPERPGALELIRHVASRGVVVALGHHRADDETLEGAIAAGARVCTHLGNGSDAMLPRLANYIWRQLGEDRLWATFIADGHHLPAATLRCMLRAKGLERSILVTDVNELAGMPPGRYTRRGGDAELTKDGKVVLAGTPYLAGSVATMPLLVANAVRHAGLAFPDAVRLATLQPESLMRRYVTSWSCEPGQSANVAQLDWYPTEPALHPRITVIERFVSETEKLRRNPKTT